MKTKFRYSLYAVVMTSLHLFSQIFFNNIASAYFNAYITAAINGIVTVECYFWIRSLQGKIFFQVFWSIYGIRIMILFFYFAVNASLNSGDDRVQFVVTFFMNYTTWLIVEITMMVKENKLEKAKQAGQ